jgi:hypothetical protein
MQPSIAATTPGAAERSMLLPAVQSLKKELHLSHENMYLLQEENKYYVTNVVGKRRTAGR